MDRKQREDLASLIERQPVTDVNIRASKQHNVPLINESDDKWQKNRTIQILRKLKLILFVVLAILFFSFILRRKFLSIKILLCNTTVASFNPRFNLMAQPLRLSVINFLTNHQIY